MRWWCHYSTCQRRYSCLRIVLTAQYHMGVSRPDLSLAEHIQNQLAASVHCTYRNSRTGPGSSQSANSVEYVMEHRTSAELKGVADVIHPQKLLKKELLERWALALEKRRGVRLRTLRETERKPVTEQSTLRQENSPLTVAFEDPVLRSAGLTNDTFGEVARFFGLSHWQLHEVVCNCHFGETVASEAVAARVRRLSGRSFATFAYGYAIAAALLAGTVLLSRVI